MAEAFTNNLLPDNILAYSAGINPGEVDKMAIEVMSKIGIDMSNQYSKTIQQLPEIEFDIVITLCDNARENCPYFPAKTKLVHHSFPDPPFLAANIDDIEQRLNIYCDVRDKIKSFVISLGETLSLE